MYWALLSSRHCGMDFTICVILMTPCNWRLISISLKRDQGWCPSLQVLPYLRFCRSVHSFTHLLIDLFSNVSVTGSVLGAIDRKLNEAHSLTHKSLYHFSTVIPKAEEISLNDITWSLLQEEDAAYNWSYLFSTFSPSFLPPCMTSFLSSNSFFHEGKISYKTQNIWSHSAMCNGHWNTMSQISVPSKTISSESISDMSETKGAPWSKSL